jgi:hypothetical protein
MEVDSETDMKRESKSGITKVIRRKAGEKPDAPKLKPRGAGELVGLGLKIKREVWLALHEQANRQRTNLTSLLIHWLNEARARDGLPPVG